MTTDEAAESLGIARATVVKQCKRGRLKASIRGGVWWILKADVEDYRSKILGKRGFGATKPPVDVANSGTVAEPPNPEPSVQSLERLAVAAGGRMDKDGFWVEGGLE